MELSWGETSWTKSVPAEATEIAFDLDAIPTGPADLMAIVRTDGEAERGPWQLYVEHQ